MKEGASTLLESIGASWHRHWQDRILDGAVTLFALWTLASHVTVAAGGTLVMVERIFLALILSAGTLRVLSNRQQRKAAPFETSTIHETAERESVTPSKMTPASPALARLRLAGVALGLVAVLGISRTDSEFLWWWVAIPLVLAAGALLWIEYRELPPIELRPAVGGWRDTLPWMLALLAVGLTLLAHRHDSDDSIYINLAVSAVDHLDQPILTGDTMHGIENLPLHLQLYKLHSFEILCAALSHRTGLPAITVFHIMAAAVAAFLLPLVLARLFRLLTPETWPWMLVFFLVVLVAVGHPHRWYGNFAFVRLWQGKSLFLFLALPLIYIRAMTFAVRPTFRGWLRLAVVQVAALGLSATALTHAPIAVMATMVAVIRPGKQAIFRLAGGVTSSLYLVVAGLLMREKTAATFRLVPRNLGSSSGERLPQALIEVLGSGELQGVALSALLLAWALTRSPLARRFSLATSLLVWLTVLNPFFEQLALRYVTGGLYWRSLWMLPLPLMITLLLASPLDLFGRHLASKLAALGLLAAFVFLVPGPHGLSEENRVRLLPFPELKVHSATYDWARQLQLESGPGLSVVAPERVGLWIPTFHHHAFPLSVGHYLKMQRQNLPPEEWRQRDLMTRFVDGDVTDLEDAASVFRLGLEHFDVRAVCLRVARNDHVEAARRVLESSGFKRGKAHSNFEVWSR